MTLNDGPLKFNVNDNVDKVITETFERVYLKDKKVYKTTTKRTYKGVDDYDDTTTTEFIIDTNHPNCGTDDCCGNCKPQYNQSWQEYENRRGFDEYGNYGENNPPVFEKGYPSYEAVNRDPNEIIERAMGIDRTVEIVKP